MDTGSVMTCPKCGTSQPHSDTCVSCHIIISKFLERQQQTSMAPPPGETYGGGGGGYAPPAYGGRPVAAPKSSGLASMLPLLILLAVSGGGGWFVWDKGYFASEAGTYNAETGVYTNKHYGFQMKLPPSLNTYDPEKYWFSPKNKYVKFYATTGDVNDTTVVVESCECYAALYGSKQWKKKAPDLLADGHKRTTRAKYEDINGITGYRYSGRWGGKMQWGIKGGLTRYIDKGSLEDTFIFKTEKGDMVQIIVYIHPQERKMKRKMRKVISTIEKL